MDKNSSYINFNGTQITLVKLEFDCNNYLDFPDENYIQECEKYVNLIKNGSFDYKKVYKVQQGSVCCFGLLVTHLGEYPSPFWFEKYKNLLITSFILREEDDYPSKLNRSDKFISNIFPGHKCLINKGKDPFILHLKFIGMEVNDCSIGKILEFELHAVPDDFECENNIYDTSVPFQAFRVGGNLLVKHSLQIDLFLKYNHFYLKLTNNEHLDIELEDLQLRKLLNTTPIKLPVILSHGKQLNLTIPINDGNFISLLQVVDFDEFDTPAVFIKWNVNKWKNENCSLWTKLEYANYQPNNCIGDITINCALNQVYETSITILLEVMSKVRVDLTVKMIKEIEPNKFKNLIPFQDSVELGLVKPNHLKTCILFFYYVTEGLHISPRMEVWDKVSNNVYKIEPKIFNIQTH
ncbi:uncharacterized protein TA11765 [Theileria annulata]|uniref:Uncharacterized protein n=1 Tax=Theileria annulata TaxID=5874 RepID=Q4UDN5_THEAN|nr:uncharacterized protein TA11765 [Theileria annulata]CAI74804.1 hypothetical protein TA11765 [Theileria annulata]|eukprot:XP_952536.1 hypothetical protein TA11765 [Theileria annulata]